jgi:hypothetical protein
MWPVRQMETDHRASPKAVQLSDADQVVTRVHSILMDVWFVPFRNDDNFVVKVPHVPAKLCVTVHDRVKYANVPSLARSE